MAVGKAWCYCLYQSWPLEPLYLHNKYNKHMKTMFLFLHEKVSLLDLGTW